MANLGVDVVGKIQHGRTQRHVEHLAAGCQNINTVFAGCGLETIQKAFIIQLVLAGIQQLPHDGDLVIESRVVRATLLVTPV